MWDVDVRLEDLVLVVPRCDRPAWLPRASTNYSGSPSPSASGKMGVGGFAGHLPFQLTLAKHADNVTNSPRFGVTADTQRGGAEARLTDKPHVACMMRLGRISVTSLAKQQGRAQDEHANLETKIASEAHLLVDLRSFNVQIVEANTFRQLYEDTIQPSPKIINATDNCEARPVVLDIVPDLSLRVRIARPDPRVALAMRVAVVVPSVQVNLSLYKTQKSVDILLSVLSVWQAYRHAHKLHQALGNSLQHIHRMHLEMQYYDTAEAHQESVGDDTLDSSPVYEFVRPRGSVIGSIELKTQPTTKRSRYAHA